MADPVFDSSQAWAAFVSQSPLSEFKKNLSHVTYEDIADSFVLLQTQPAVDSKEKLISLFHYIQARGELETFAKHLTLPRFLNLLNFFSLNPDFQSSLPYLLTGLKPEIFSKGLNFYHPEHLGLFKEEAILEPIQYHLNQFIHEGEAMLSRLNEEEEQFEKSLPMVIPENLTVDQFNDLIHRIHRFRNEILDFLDRARTALSIAWSTDRVELIEKLSNLNETMQHRLALIGHPSSEGAVATGLYSRIEQVLSQVFDSSLKDEDASVEGLTRLAVWHLKDYWDLGLLPDIRSPHELDLDPKEHNDIQRSAHHQKLFFQVQRQLDRLKIGTVGDLKKACLFSRPLLKAYIENRRLSI